ncbi:MAG: DUF6110 family protein [Clostridia bacterium]|nr:DUF6110 family protein [Clostridia bacterium]
MKYDHTATFLAGALAGTVGIAILTSREAKRVYTYCTAVALRGKDSVMKTVASVKENCGDIYADAKGINDAVYEQERAVELENARAIVEQYEKEAAENID